MVDETVEGVQTGRVGLCWMMHAGTTSAALVSAHVYITCIANALHHLA